MIFLFGIPSGSTISPGISTFPSILADCLLPADLSTRTLSVIRFSPKIKNKRCETDSIQRKRTWGYRCMAMWPPPGDFDRLLLMIVLHLWTSQIEERAGGGRE